MVTAAAPRKRMQTTSGPRSLDIEEREKARDARDSILAVAQPGELILFSPVYPYLSFGPGSGWETNDDLIRFGPEPHVAKVPREHRLLGALLKAHPEIEVVERESERRYYLCEKCDREFPSKAVLAFHRGQAHDAAGQGDQVGRPLAKKPPSDALRASRNANLAKGRARGRIDEPEDVPEDDGGMDDEPPDGETEPEE